MALQAQGRLAEGYECLRNWLRARVRGGERMASTGAGPVSIPRTTLACIDCRDQDLAAHALARCLERCRFERALFFSDAPLALAGVEPVAIPRISSSEAYSRFVMKELDRHVDTDFVLLVQYDGFVLDSRRWSSEFLSYDYIGACWPSEDWMTVGNGGFSLRSKRLLQALQDPEIAAMDPEDLAICKTNRALLEDRYGIRFAPDEVAAAFSFETIPSASPTFGFHGLGHLVNLFDRSDAEVAAYRPPRLNVHSR